MDATKEGNYQFLVEIFRTAPVEFIIYTPTNSALAI